MNSWSNSYLIRKNKIDPVILSSFDPANPVPKGGPL
jgi:hypothetical protein